MNPVNDHPHYTSHNPADLLEPAGCGGA